MSRDGATLLVADNCGGSHAVHEFVVASGARRRVVGKKAFFGGRGAGDGPAQFSHPSQVCVSAADDDCVFVADTGNNRVQVLTPGLDFHGFVGVGQLAHPTGVCANADVVVVAERDTHRVTVFNRRDGVMLRRFGSEGSGNGQLKNPHGLCFMHDNRHVAVADCGNSRVSVFSVEGEFVRHVGVGELIDPTGVACSAVGELVVADVSDETVAVFSSSGELLKNLGHHWFNSVSVHGGSVFAQDSGNQTCIVFT